MTKVLYTLLFVVFAGTISAQSYEGTIDYKKTRQAVALIQLAYSRQGVDDAVSDYMARRGAKSAGVKSFTVYRSIRLNDADSSLSDLYFMSEPKSRQEKDVTVLTLLPMKNNQDILSRMPGDSALIPQARSFLDSLAPYVNAYVLNLQINDQDAQVKKARKKMDDLMNDQADLEKKIRGLESDLDDNKKAQAKEAADLQSNITLNDDAKKKNQKRLQKLLDQQGNLEKKLRRAKSDLDQNSTDQRQQQAEIDKQQQILDGIKAKQVR